MKLAQRLKITNSDAAGGARKFDGGLDRVISFIAIAMTVYHLYVAIFGLPEWLVHRPLHVAFFLCLGFLMYRGSKKKDYGAGIVIDLILAAASVFVYIYILMNFDRLSRYMFMVTKLTAMDYFVIVLTFFLILEITRRTTGWSIIIVAAVFVVYTLYAKYMPAAIRGASVSLKNYLAYMFCVSDGLFGSTVNISSTYVFLFIVFGCFLEASGVGKFFIDFATHCTSGLRGGSAKASILASGLFGSISGSAVANVYATGTFTIPLMKKAGFKNEVAGATEAVASSGGAIMPPVMGSTAFLMADFLGVSYAAICKAALIPAILYYLSLWFMLDMEAWRLGMKKVPKSERDAFDWKDFFKQIYMVAPIVVIIVVLLMGKSVFRAAFLAILTTIAVGLIHDPKSMSPRAQYDYDGAKCENLKALACLNIRQYLGITTTADYTSVEDMVANPKGLKIAVGPRGGGNEIMLNRYLEQLDTSLDELAAQGADVQYISASEGYTAIKDGNVNTCNYQAAIPLSSLVEALASLKMNFISLDQATAEKVADIYGYSYDYIPAGSYQYQDSDVGTLCDTVILVINSDVDDAVAYNMAKALAENKDALVSAHASFEAMDAQVMAQCGIDLHPGAQAYYESAGLL